MSVITKQEVKMKFAKKYEGYEIVPHPEHKRLYHIVLDGQLLGQFSKGKRTFGAILTIYSVFAFYYCGSNEKALW